MALLRSEGAKHGLHVRVLALCRPGAAAGVAAPADVADAAADDADESVVAASSTAVRQLVLGGRVAEAAPFLDRRYALLVPRTAAHAAVDNGATARGCRSAEGGHGRHGDRALSFERDGACNQVPGDGRYAVDVACVCAGYGSDRGGYQRGVLHMHEGVGVLDVAQGLSQDGDYLRMELIDRLDSTADESRLS